MSSHTLLGMRLCIHVGIKMYCVWLWFIVISITLWCILKKKKQKKNTSCNEASFVVTCGSAAILSSFMAQQVVLMTTPAATNGDKFWFVTTIDVRDNIQLHMEENFSICCFSRSDGRDYFNFHTQCGLCLRSTYVSKNWVIINLDNGLSSIRRHDLSGAMLAYGQYRETLNKGSVKCRCFHFRKC